MAHGPNWASRAGEHSAVVVTYRKEETGMVGGSSGALYSMAIQSTRKGGCMETTGA
uniref:Uncharacterized protein n=1 Tax=Oryza alta TaxID=52545 RepID=A0A1V1H6M9_9ORYZ|nr:hypothetical protein [Oryza alta]